MTFDATDIDTVARSAKTASGSLTSATETRNDATGRSAAQPSLNEVELVPDAGHGILWQYMAPSRRPSFTLEMLGDMKTVGSHLRQQAASHGQVPFQYVVTGSRAPDIFNLGGDLPSFVELIEAGDRDGLRRYAHTCIEVQHMRACSFGLPVCTISLVQGDALGGGFECALTDDIILAEKRAKFGLPEILFGLFPGMGAYSFLGRRVSPAFAEQLILDGAVHSAEAMYEAGIVDGLLEDGEGADGVYAFLRREERRMTARRALHSVRRRVNPVSWEELRDVTDTWVETALSLSPMDVRKMQRLAQAQDRRWTKAQATGSG